jgi:hypothetical protein
VPHGTRSSIFRRAELQRRRLTALPGALALGIGRAYAAAREAVDIRVIQLSR